MKPTPLRALPAFGLILLACSHERSGAGAPTSSAGAQGQPPAGIASWTATVGGSVCRHPGVTARCAFGWCEIPAGCFVMGSPESEWGRGLADEEPTAVTLTRAFAIQQYEVRQRDWVAAGLRNPSGEKEYGRDCADADCPVGQVSWQEAMAYANRLSAANEPPLAPCYNLDQCLGEVGNDFTCASVGLTASTAYECEGFRLPTEAEWEYAARAGTRTAFYTGEISAQADTATCSPDAALEPAAWYCANAGKATHPVGKKQPNAWWLFDMLGNANEWVQDDQHDWMQLPTGAVTDPSGELRALTGSRVLKGGLYNGLALMLRASASLSGTPDGRGPGIGFRLVRTLTR